MKKKKKKERKKVASWENYTMVGGMGSCFHFEGKLVVQRPNNFFIMPSQCACSPTRHKQLVFLLQSSTSELCNWSCSPTHQACPNPISCLYKRQLNLSLQNCQIRRWTVCPENYNSELSHTERNCFVFTYRISK